ncbi:MAG TPA: hypothetical protein PKW90_19470 [Myxococcota bacterium]|nr:hypothetical protein [Myxococcota bacterium]
MYHSTSLVHSIDPTLRRAAATLRRPILSQAEAWIVGGPEDGRCLRLRTGATLGRASAGSIVDIAFYAESQVSDRYLSKRVGDWDGRHLRLEQSADLRNGQHLTVGTAYAPGSGDLLDLTPRTTLLFGPPEITLE